MESYSIYDSCEFSNEWNFTSCLVILKKNQCLNWWLCFLSALKIACPVSNNSHHLHRVPFLNYTMGSKRQKGLAAGLYSVSLRSHTTHCVLHIQRNIFQIYGLKAAVNKCPIAKTYMTIKYLFKQIKDLEANDYLKIQWN